MVNRIIKSKKVEDKISNKHKVTSKLKFSIIKRNLQGKIK